MQLLPEKIATDYKKLGLSLGMFSIALGLVEVAAPERLARLLGMAPEAKRVIGLFGARELLAGAMLLGRSRGFDKRVEFCPWRLNGPWRAWNRVKRLIPKGGFVGGALAFVVGATIIDIIAARGLGEQTARTFPRSQRLGAT